MDSLQKRYQYQEHFRKAIQQGNYPLGTIAYYGPNEQTITKVVAAVLPDEHSDPVLMKITGNGVVEKPETAAAIGDFFQKHHVNHVVMTEGVIGCPHEEGVDFPIGEICNECEFWN